MRRPAFVIRSGVALSLVALGRAGAQAVRQSPDAPGEVVATGRGTVSPVRDRVLLVFAVEEDAATAAAAEAGYARRHAALREVLRAAGPRGRDVRTTAYQVRTAITNDEVTRADFLRYTAASLVTVLADSAGVGRFIDRAMQAGATALVSAQAASSDTAPARRDAVAAAVAAACRDADAAARATGLQLGPAVDIVVTPALRSVVTRDDVGFVLPPPPPPRPPGPRGRIRPLLALPPRIEVPVDLPADVVQVTARWVLRPGGSAVGPDPCAAAALRGRSRS